MVASARRALRLALRRFGVGAVLLAAPLSLSAAAAAGDSAPKVLVTEATGTITPVIADHLDDAVDKAERDGHEALIVELDTPGGLDASMRDIAQRFLDARVPVVVYVAPSGARAASAGTIITLAAHVAAMAPGTTIGAATPIDLQGGDLERKVINEAASYSEEIARLRGRNTEFARDAVRRGTAIGAEQAVEDGVVDLLARDRAELLRALDGRRVELAGADEVVIETTGAREDRFRLATFRSVLQWLADPNLAFLFLSLGTLAILYELANPGVGAGGITGAIMLVLAFFSLSVLPVNAASLIFLVLAAGLFVAELFAPGIGVFAGGGTVSFVLAAMFLFRGSVGVDAAVFVPTAAVVGGVAVVIGRYAIGSRRVPRVSGAESLVGRTVVVRAVRDDRGQALVEGAWWSVRSAAGGLEVGDEMRVAEVDGLELVGEPVVGERAGSPDAPRGSNERERREGGEP